MSSSLNNVLSSQRNSKKFLNAKVTFNTEFGNKKDDGGNEDGSKTITVMTGDNQYIKVFAQKFTDENLKQFIQEYAKRKYESHDDVEQYSSLFCTTLSSIRSMKNIPLEYTHSLDKDERFLKKFEQQTKDWRNSAIEMSKIVPNKSPQSSILRRSDAFSEVELRKAGKISSESTYYKSMNSWYANLRQSNKEDARRSTYIQRNPG